MAYFTIGILVAYLAGSIPFGIIVTRLVKGVDVRDFGSGSTGFTNVYRVTGVPPALVVAALDIAKGFVAVYIVAPLLFESTVGLPLIQFQIICGSASVIGHIFTIFARFRGGKGVLTALGVCVALLPVEVAIAVAVFGVVFAVTRFISAGSLAGAASLPISVLTETYALGHKIEVELLIFTIILAIVIFYAHRDNIKRLVKGEENKFKRVGP
ncbi:MAG: glycerol-3-phosphate 1-O-acyltransferase PlsY [Candidatus Zixiibacteriota bacterium]